MQFDITIQNYRCFTKDHPAHITFRPGATALLGVNNSGKSSLLRFFVEFRDLFNKLSDDNSSLMNALFDPQPFVIGQVTHHKDVFSKCNNKDIKIVFEATVDSTLVPNRIVITIRRNQTAYEIDLYKYDKPYIRSADPSDVSPTNQSDAVLNARALGLYFGAVTKGILYKMNDSDPADLRPWFDVWKLLARSLYIGPFRNALDVDGSKDYFDIKVGRAFMVEWRNFKYSPDPETKTFARKVEKDIARILSITNLDIEVDFNGQTMHITIDDQPFLLHEVGGGMTQIILVMGLVAMRKPSIIMIDEPEIGLHPSLQIEFLRTLATYAPNVTVIFATHSIGLAHAYAEQKYYFRRHPDGSTEVTDYQATPRIPEFLGELSFSAYKELGFEKILLVEGPTDLKVFLEFLAKYEKEHKVVLLHLGGESSINKNFADQVPEILKICEHVYALVDSDRTSLNGSPSDVVIEFLKACKNVIKAKATDRRCTESYFTNRAIEAAKTKVSKALGPYDDVPGDWDKSQNWLIAREMTKQELDTTDIGAFLRDM